MMKYLFCFLLVGCSTLAFCQTNDVNRTLQAVLEHAEEASLYRNTIDWEATKKAVTQLAKNAQSVEALKPAFDFLLKTLGDEHGRIFHNNRILSYYNGTQQEHQQHLSHSIYNDIQSGRVYSFKGELLEKNIGYIRIVGLPMGDNQAMAKVIQDKVCELYNAGAEKWIVDLRYNGGGNMHPMAEGIAAIIGNGIVGGSSGLTPDESSVWQVIGGDFYYDDYSVQLENDCKIETDVKVAVLTSVYTASSGEAIAVIFKGRENTRFFGEKTLGMITVTDWHTINNNTAMSISVSYYKDRNGITYDKFVDVDEEVRFQPENDEDEGLQKAINWLKE